MPLAYFHSDETLVRAPARDCYDLVLAVRRYAQWWTRVRCEPLGPEAVLRIGSRFRFAGGPVSWVIEVAALTPWRRIDLVYADGDLLGPVSWEFMADGAATRVRHAYRGVRPNSEHTERSFASGRALRLHSEVMREDAFAGMRRVLERGAGVSGGDLFEAIHTLRAVRHFRDEPVPEAILHEVLAAATRAASARNAQPWYFVAVRAAEPKRTIGRLYLSAWRQAQAYAERSRADADIETRPDHPGMMRRVDHLAANLAAAPVLILACLDTRQLGPIADRAGNILSAPSAYASIFPAVQNLMLAARGLGLGTTLTTIHLAVEGEIRAALGIPDHVHVAALIPLGYPTRPFRLTERKPVSEVAFLDTWGNPLPAPE
jgi:nitroreductase/uncharacterized protein YndB with AHSA1/START domain